MGFWQIIWIVIMALDLGIDLCEYTIGQRSKIWTVFVGDIISLLILYEGGFFG